MSQFSSDSHLPPDRTRPGREPFRFHCHPDVSCYLNCCRNVDLLLFPYDVLRLKAALGLHSEEFVRRHTRICEGSHPYFPGLKLQLVATSPFPCPFLREQGCAVYVDRPSACRTYPLERGVERSEVNGSLASHYFMTHHPYCKGHFEERTQTVRQWERDQDLHDFNLHNDLWAELDAFFATNPFSGEGKAGPRQQLAFMVCYNIDGFRAYAAQHRLIEQFRLEKSVRRRIQQEDAHLLRFGFQWLHYVLGGVRFLVPR